MRCLFVNFAIGQPIEESCALCVRRTSNKSIIKLLGSCCCVSIFEATDIFFVMQMWNPEQQHVQSLDEEVDEGVSLTYQELSLLFMRRSYTG